MLLLETDLILFIVNRFNLLLNVIYLFEFMKPLTEM